MCIMDQTVTLQVIGMNDDDDNDAQRMTKVRLKNPGRSPRYEEETTSVDEYCWYIKILEDSIPHD